MTDKENIIKFKICKDDGITEVNGDKFYSHFKEWYLSTLNFINEHNIQNLKINEEGLTILQYLDNQLNSINLEINQLNNLLEYCKQLSTQLGDYILQSDDKSILFQQIQGFFNLLPKYIKSAECNSGSFIKVQKTLDSIKEEIDFSTGHLSQKGFNKALKRSFELVRKSNKGTIGIIYFDGNDLKTVNDSFGQEFGQEYIYQMGNVIEKIIKQHQKKYDFYYRMSNIKHGDERVVLLTNISKSTLHSIVRSLFRYLNKHNIQVFDQRIKMSMCAGVSYIKAYPFVGDQPNPEYDCLGGFTHSNLYYLANTGLMAAKRKKGIKGILNRYVFNNIRDVGDATDYKRVKSSLPKIRSFKSLMKKTITQLRIFRAKFSSQLTFARNIEEKEILTNNINIINQVIANKISTELENDFDILEKEFLSLLSDLNADSKEEVKNFEKNKADIIEKYMTNLISKKDKYLNIYTKSINN